MANHSPGQVPSLVILSGKKLDKESVTAKNNSILACPVPDAVETRIGMYSQSSIHKLGRSKINPAIN